MLIEVHSCPWGLSAALGVICFFMIDKIEGVIQSLGGQLKDVVRTRVYIRDLKDREDVACVHGERFPKILPANTLIQASLVGGKHLVEMEAEAIVMKAGDGSD